MISFISISSVTKTGLAYRRSLSVNDSDRLTYLFSRTANGDFEGLSFTNVTLFCARLPRTCHQQCDEISRSCGFRTGGQHVYPGERADLFLFEWKLCGDETSGKGEKEWGDWLVSKKYEEEMEE